MLWSILAIGGVGGIGAVTSFIIGRKFFKNESFVSPDQGGTLYKGYWDELDVACSRHHDNDD